MFRILIAIAKRQSPATRFFWYQLSGTARISALPSAEQDRVPTRPQREPRAPYAPLRIAPLQRDGNGSVPGDVAQPEMQVGAPLAGVAVAAIHLRRPLHAITQRDERGRPDCGPARRRVVRM